MNFTIVPLSGEHYDDWDAVCRASQKAWFWHTTQWLDYTVAYNPALESKSCSFLLYENSSAVAAVPLLMERIQNGQAASLEFSFGGGWLPSPVCISGLSSKKEKQIFKAAFDHIFALARDKNIARIRCRSNPFVHLQSKMAAFIPTTVQYGFTPYLLPTQIIDVTKNSAILLKEMRKGHRSDIKKGEKKLESFVISNENISYDLFEAYRQLHNKAAGGQTRPAETFEMMYEWIKNGFGTLFGAKLDGRPVSFAYVNTYKDCAYYSSACNDPEIQNLPLAHFVQWHILKWLHDHNFHHYEIGWQFYSPTVLFPVSIKEIAISSFKRGFGGITVPMVLSEKFFSRNDYLAVSRERTKYFAETLPGTLESSIPSAKEVVL